MRQVTTPNGKTKQQRQLPLGIYHYQPTHIEQVETLYEELGKIDIVAWFCNSLLRYPAPGRVTPLSRCDILFPHFYSFSTEMPFCTG